MLPEQVLAGRTVAGDKWPEQSAEVTDSTVLLDNEANMKRAVSALTEVASDTGVREGQCRRAASVVDLAIQQLRKKETTQIDSGYPFFFGPLQLNESYQLTGFLPLVLFFKISHSIPFWYHTPILFTTVPAELVA